MAIKREKEFGLDCFVFLVFQTEAKCGAYHCVSLKNCQFVFSYDIYNLSL
jgi:hypothetical protein